MNIYEKLIKIQNELKVPKDKNAMGKYKYRNADDIYENVKPLLEKYSLTLFVNDEVEMIGDRFYLKAICVLTDGETTITSNAYAREPETVRNGMSEQQITGASSSYARKYALGGLFLIDNQDDVDSEAYQIGSNNANSKEKSNENAEQYKANSSKNTYQRQVNSNRNDVQQELSQAQIKRLFGKAKEYGHTNEEVKSLMISTFKKNTTSQLTKIEYDKLIEIMENTRKK